MTKRQNIGLQLLSAALSVLGGIVAGKVSHRIWERIAPTSPAPAPKDLSRGVGEVLAAAALQGAIYAIVQAAIDRAGARAITAVSDVEPV